jgi:polysaccharide chain length determinant protein (PEP-CTERM system associated)
MQDTLEHLWSYVLGIWRHRWLALIVVWVISVAGWTFVSRMPESYVATARVYVDTSSMLGPLMRGLTVNADPNDRISMMSRTLLSRPNLERLARMTDLDVEAVTEAEQQSLIASLENSISLSGNRSNDSLYSISVTHRERETARRLTESLITVFIEESMSDQNTDSSEAQSFLDQQIAESELRLVEAENSLADFKRDNASMLPGDTGDYYQRLQQARSALQDAQLELRELENRRENLDRQLEGEEPVFIAGGSQGLGQGTSITPLDQRIQVLQLELNALLVRYTDQHPEVRRLRSLLTELERSRTTRYGALFITL